MNHVPPIVGERLRLVYFKVLLGFVILSLIVLGFVQIGYIGGIDKLYLKAIKAPFTNVDRIIPRGLTFLFWVKT